MRYRSLRVARAEIYKRNGIDSRARALYRDNRECAFFIGPRAPIIKRNVRKYAAEGGGRLSGQLSIRIVRGIYGPRVHRFYEMRDINEMRDGIAPQIQKQIIHLTVDRNLSLETERGGCRGSGFSLFPSLIFLLFFLIHVAGRICRAGHGAAAPTVDGNDTEAGRWARDTRYVDPSLTLLRETGSVTTQRYQSRCD